MTTNLNDIAVCHSTRIDSSVGLCQNIPADDSLLLLDGEWNGCHYITKLYGYCRFITSNTDVTATPSFTLIFIQITDLKRIKCKELSYLLRRLPIVVLLALDYVCYNFYVAVSVC